MKVAYVCYWNLLENDGVAYKIQMQIDHWHRAGFQVEVFCLSRRARLEDPGKPHWSLFPFSSLAGRFTATRRLEQAVIAFRPDLVYLRYDLFLPPLPRLLSRFPTAVEQNANDRNETRVRPLRPRSAFVYNEFNRRQILGKAAGCVCLTHELASSALVARFRKPTVVIANGVDLDAAQPLPHAPATRPRAVFLGSRGQVWHGVDKILGLAAELPELDFDVVGYGADDLDARLPPNVTAHGILSRAGYEPLLARADVAIGTLALHRKQMQEACPLKVREYLAYGLPVVIAYDDTDFLGEQRWFLLQLPNTESNVQDSVAEIRRFVERIRGRRVAREEIAQRIGAHMKEPRRLAFLRELVRADDDARRRHAASAAR